MSAKKAWEKLNSQIDCGYYLTNPELEAIEKSLEEPKAPAKKAPAKKKPVSKK